MTWFRGAAISASLDTTLKSVVAYGENGAGKSSFVDAVEFLMSGGKIRHLAHEYSGKRQEKGIINTHTPEGENAKIAVSVAGGAQVTAEIEHNGKYTCSGIEAMDGWDYGRMILRQNEVADFIHGTKGAKYSALLPLFGLYPLELAAQNVRQLAKEIERQFEISSIRDLLIQIEPNRKRIFGGDDDAQILAKVDALHAKYASDKAGTVDSETRCEEVNAAVENRIERSTAEHRRYLAIQSAAEVDLKADIESVQAANAKLAGAVEPMIQRVT
ncbi:MAG: AAA family ATPase [Limisphaerales bacterium]